MSPKANKLQKSREKQSENMKAAKLLGALLLLVGLVAPFSYAIGGLEGLTLALRRGLTTGILAGIVIGYHQGFHAGLATMLFAGIGVGISGPLVWDYAGNLGTGFVKSLAATFGLGLAVPFAFAEAAERRRVSVIISLAAGFTTGLVVGPFWTIPEVFGHGWTTPEGRYAIFLGAIGGASGGGIGMAAGPYVGHRLKSWLLVFPALWPYLREMLAPLSGVAFGYLALIFLFAAFYGAAWRTNPCCAFNGFPQDPSFTDFLYFSLVTIATLGSGDITPSSDVTKWLIFAEVIAGFSWITVVFAAVIAHLSPRFTKIAERQQRVERQK